MKIVLVDDHTLFREGLASLLKAQADMELVGMAGTVREAVEITLEKRPDIVLIDFGLGDGTGLEATQKILAQLPEVKIIFLTIYDDDERLFSALRHGAKGYLPKNVSVSKLLDYLRGAQQGEAAITPLLTSRVLAQFARLNQNHHQVEAIPEVVATLTARELEVLKQIRTGATNQEIADRLVISERTVKNHISSILAKLNLKNRYAAARLAQRLDLPE